MVADRSVLVRLRADISDFQRKFATAGATTSVFVKNLESADTRMGNLVQTALALGPALVPIAATGTPALIGLTSQLGVAAAGVGVLVSAFNGIGGSLDAVNKYQLDPTNANLKKMREEMSKLPAEGRHFVRFLDQEVLPALDWLQDTAAEGALPGFEDSLNSLMDRLPELSGLVEDLATTGGRLADEAGDAIASDQLDEFFAFLKAEAEPSLLTLGRTVGNVLDGLATSLIGLNPLANDFEEALLDWSRGFADIEPEDFAEFVDYVRSVGPDAIDALAAVGGGLVAIVKAAAPVGAVALPAIEALANVIEVIAESPAGPALIGTAAGVAAISRAIALFKAANGSALVTTIQGVGKASPAATAGLARMNQTISAMKTGAPILAGLALAYSDVDDKAGLSNTAMFATAGLIAGPWGAAIGAAIGLFFDWKAAGAEAEAQNRAFEASLQGMSLEQLNAGLAEMQALLAALGNPDDIGGDLVRQRIRGIEDQIDATKKLAAEQEAERRAAAMAYAEQVGLNLKANQSIRLTTEQIKAQAQAMQELHDRADATSKSFLAFPDSLNKAKVSLSQFITEMQQSADALSNFNVNSRKAAKNGLDDGLIMSLRDAGVEGALRMKQLANASESEIARANKAYRSHQRAIEETRRLTERLVGMSPVKIDVNAQTGAAMTNLRSLEAYLRSIKDEDVFVNVRHRQYGQSGGFGPVDGGADGMTVPGARTPYGDKDLYALAPGEEVISNRFGQADRHRPLLKAINGGLADGGTTGKSGGKKGKGPSGAWVTDVSDLIDRFGSLAQALRASERALDRETSQRDKAASTLESTRQAFADIAKATTSGFTGDPFAERPGDSNIWAPGARGGGSDPIRTLQEQIAYGTERGSLQQQLQAAGLGGSTAGEQAALEEALRSGDNASLAALLAGGQVQQFEDLFIQRQGVEGMVGGQAGEMLFGDDLRGQTAELERQTAELREVKQELRELRQEERARESQRDSRADARADRQADRTGDRVNGAAAAATRKNPRPRVGRL